MRESRLVVTIVTALCFVTLFALAFREGQAAWPGPYDLWSDINNDGKINYLDLGKLLASYGATGTNVSKLSIEYDSEWVDIADKQGQNITITHGLNSSDVMVDITGKTTVDGGQHQRQLGMADYYIALGLNETYGGASYDKANALVQTGDGGYALAGTTSSYGDGLTDFWLVKTEVEVYSAYGFSWIDSTANTIVLIRGSEDPYWNYVRVHVWQPKLP